MTTAEKRQKRLAMALALAKCGYAPSAVRAEIDRQYPLTDPKENA